MQPRSDESARAGLRLLAVRPRSSPTIIRSVGSQDGSQTKLGELRGAVEEADRHGLPATAHVHAVPAIANAVAAGVDVIEHWAFLTATASTPTLTSSTRWPGPAQR